MNPTATNPCERIAAFFDLDGTLLPAPSLEWRFVPYLLSRDEIPNTNIVRWLARSIWDSFRNRVGTARANKSYLAGLRTSLVTDWERALRPGSLAFFSSGLDRIRWHFAQGHSVYLVSGTLEPLARLAAHIIWDRIGDEINVLATKLESLDGFWTGFLSADHMSAEAKARAIRAVSEERRFDLSRCFAYGDEISDLPMLSAVGHPAAVNPSSRLARAARIRGWRILEWQKLEESPSSLARNPKRAVAHTFSPRLIP